ncbi:Crp/Fnr family transcriptional regulator [Terrimonas alba]|uniref:Crp/Fnr family transcriptional regulator n=1 Tax=Terrimonas alba TaxID=3349636 RepID=UPI0035F3314D
MEQLLAFLHSVYPLSKELYDHLFSIIRTKNLAKREMLLKAGHVCRNIHYIESGLLRCYYNKADTEVCSWFMKENDLIVSIESFYRQTTSYESIQALEDCTLHYIEYTELYNIFRNYAEFNYVARELTQHYYILWAQQLYGLRMQTPVERLDWLYDHSPELLLRVPAKHLASYLGIGEVTLSRIKKKKFHRSFLDPVPNSK